jgi:hypothetical protein
MMTDNDGTTTNVEASPKPHQVRIVVPLGAQAERLDKYLMGCNLDVTRSALNRLFQEKSILVDGREGKKGSKACGLYSF